MIKEILWLKTENTYPYKNLAMEEYLTMNVKDGQCIMYLWQNRHTVVIGKNQNCWKECKVTKLEEDGGYLVRRLSGGGAVYHDLGNLNFTFCVKEEDYNLDKQLSVILEAAKLLGIKAEKTGRNDITVQGRKFSGNAFLKIGKQCYHHGTIMLNVNGSDMAKYLNVDMKKLQSNGVDSVASRVASLIEFRPDISVAMMEASLIKSFSQVYGLTAKKISEEKLPAEEISKLQEKFQSWDWKYGKKIPFNHEICERFPWGDIQIQLKVNGGIIEDINFFSDAMEQDVITLIKGALSGREYNAPALIDAVVNAKLEAASENASLISNIKRDLVSCIAHNI